MTTADHGRQDPEGAPIIAEGIGGWGWCTVVAVFILAVLLVANF